MVYVLADNIISPLGMSSEENYHAVKSGQTALRQYSDGVMIPETFTASLMSHDQKEGLRMDGTTPFEAMVTASVKRALEETAIDLAHESVVFVLSTTKGNIELLSQDNEHQDDLYLGTSARHIAESVGIQSTPVVVCNACTSGGGAILLASRLLECGLYDYAVVSGAEYQSPFIISGFQSLKALSPEACRPFDLERMGLNPGEAAATMVLGRKPLHGGCWAINAGCVRNDAYHISAPSKNGEGAFLALKSITEKEDLESLAFINAHGTATMFNDQMESVAIERAGLGQVPVFGLKGYYGHTMGAAGILETIISMKALDDETVLGTKGFDELGVSGRISLSPHNQHTEKKAFVKMLSGFGGGNVALWVTQHQERDEQKPLPSFTVAHHVTISPKGVWIDGRQWGDGGEGPSLLSEIYKKEIGDYPKYHKMDVLSRLGFAASELLLNAEGERMAEAREDRAVVFFNRSSSICADKAYLETIADKENYFPSPSLFVYTLPNIVTGEIAIRNHYHGETSFYVMDQRDEDMMGRVVQASFCDGMTKSILGGWLDYEDDAHFMADIFLYVVN